MACNPTSRANQLRQCASGCPTPDAVIQDVPEAQGSAHPGMQLAASASGGQLALPAGINPEDIAEGSIRFFHDDLCLSIPFKGEHFMSIDVIKALSPRELILLYEVSPCAYSLPLPVCHCTFSIAPSI